MKPTLRTALLAGGTVAAAIVLAAGAVTVANAVVLPQDSSRVLVDRGIDTSTVSPVPIPSPSSSVGHPTPEPGDDHGSGVVTVPPVGPTVIDRHGEHEAPDDQPGADDATGHDATGHDGTGSDQGSRSDDAGGDSSQH